MTTASQQATRQLYWDDVSVGDTLPEYTMELTPLKMVEHVSGSQDFSPVHHNVEFARSAGHEDIFVNTGFTRATLGRILTDWIGEQGWLRKLGFQMRKQNRPGDTLTIRGRVTAVRDGEDGMGEVDVDVWIENDRDGIATPGEATVLLPKRNS